MTDYELRYNSYQEIQFYFSLVFHVFTQISVTGKGLYCELGLCLKHPSKHIMQSILQPSNFCIVSEELPPENVYLYTVKHSSTHLLFIWKCVWHWMYFGYNFLCIVQLWYFPNAITIFQWSLVPEDENYSNFERKSMQYKINQKDKEDWGPDYR